MRPLNKPVPPKTVNLNPHDGISPYDIMQIALIDTIGEYCSFCEVRVGEPNINSKVLRYLKNTPSLEQWPDLLLECDYCHLYKKDVSQGVSYFWPDTDTTFALDPSISPYLYLKRAVDYTIISDANEIDSSEQRDLVLVQINPTTSCDVQIKAQQTIELYQLNTPFYDQKNNTFTITQADIDRIADSRITNRTRAWQLAEECVAQLEGECGEKYIPASFEATLRMITMLAQSTGFWSVWMTVFWEALQNMTTPLGKIDLIKKLFVETSTMDGYIISGYQSLPRPKPQAVSAPARPRPSRPTATGETWKIFTGTASERITYGSTQSTGG